MFFLIQKKREFAILAILFFLLIPFKPTYYNTLAPKNIVKVIQVIRHKSSFFSIYQLPVGSYLTETDVNQITKIIQKQKKSVYIYPYDSYILNIVGKTYNSFTLGTYLSSNSLIEQETIRGLQASPPSIVIIAVDNKGAIALDNIPNFTRNPLIAKWLIKSYSLLQTDPKYIVLRVDPYKKQIKINRCQGYQLTIKLSQGESLLQKIVDIFKQPLYYMGATRLPYAPWSDTYLIFPNIASENGLKNLFTIEKNINCSNYYKQNSQDIVINRIDPIFRRNQTFVFNKKEFIKKSIDL